jgi:hypothetical protein
VGLRGGLHSILVQKYINDCQHCMEVLKGTKPNKNQFHLLQ